MSDVLDRILDRVERRENKDPNFGSLFDDREIVYGDDAGWQEHKHPRAPDGKFTSGPGGGASKAANLKPDPAQFKGNKPKQKYTEEKLAEIDAALASAQPYKKLKKVAVKVATNKELADYLHAVAMENHPSVAKGIGAESLALRPDPQAAKYDYKKKEISEKLSLIDDALESADPYAALSEIELKASTQSEVYAYQQALLKELNPAKKLGVPQDVINTMPDPASWEYKYQQQIAKAKIAEINAALTKPDPVDALAAVQIDGKAYQSIAQYKQDLIDNMGAAPVQPAPEPLPVAEVPAQQGVASPATPSAATGEPVTGPDAPEAPTAGYPPEPPPGAYNEPEKQVEAGDVPPVAAAAPSTKVPESTLKKIGEKLGSNAGYQAVDSEGNKKYVKLSKSDNHANNEVCAAKLYELAGAGVVKYNLLERDDGKLGTVTDWDSSLKPIDMKNPAAIKAERENFAVHAWLANWDSVGLAHDNAATLPDGTPVTMDVGGAMLYRAQGEDKKTWGPDAIEWESMRNPAVNKEAASVYGGMTDEELKNSAKKLAGIKDEDIKALVAANGPGDDAAKAKLAETLIARRDDILSKAGIAKGAEPAAPEPATSVAPTPAAPTYGPPHSKNAAPSKETAHFGPNAKAPKELHGVAFAPWHDAPKTDVEWNNVEGQNHAINEPPKPDLKGKAYASGLLIKEADGRVWLVKPKDSYGGVDATFPKGKVDPGLNSQANAIKEAFEESGLKAKITGYAGDYERSTSVSRYYWAERVGGTPDVLGGNSTDNPNHWESSGAILVPPEELHKYLSHNADKKLIAEQFNNKGSPANVSTPPQHANGPSPAAQAHIAKAVAAVKGHATYDQTSYIADASGTEIKSKLNVSSKNVKGGFYEKVTAAYGNNPENGMTHAVDKAMQEYHDFIYKEHPKTYEQTQALKGYKDGTYENINEALRGDAPMTPSIKEKIEHIKKTMHPLPANTPGFRGVRCTFEKLTKFKNPQDAIGQCFEHANFASISRDRSVSEGFARHTSEPSCCLMKFTLPAGAEASLTYDQTTYERELLLHEKSTWRIDKVEESKLGSKPVHIISITYLGKRED